MVGRSDELDHGDAAAARQARAAQRADWPVRIVPLDVHEENLAGSTTLEQRLAMMWPLALDAWAFTGRPLPDYSREDTPVTIRDRGSLDGDE